MNPPRPKVPRTPPSDLVHGPGDIITVRPLLWRIHRTQGSHVLPWNQLRRFGPIPTMRYDPQPEPAAPSIEGVLYTATSLATALAETFQATRVVDSRSFEPQATAWTPTRDLQLLDLTGGWALRNGAAFALATAPQEHLQGVGTTDLRHLARPRRPVDPVHHDRRHQRRPVEPLPEQPPGRARLLQTARRTHHASDCRSDCPCGTRLPALVRRGFG